MKVTLAFVLMISLTVIANIFMKLGGMVPVHERTFSIVDWRTIFGMGVFGLGACVYAWILSFLLACHVTRIDWLGILPLSRPGCVRSGSYRYGDGFLS